MIKCSICGEQIDDGYKYCPGCGNVIHIQKLKKNNNDEENFINKKIGKNRVNNQKENSKIVNTSNALPRKLTTTKLFYIIFFLFLIGIIIIYSSGIFDNSVSITSGQNGNINNPHAGVDLTALEQINSLEESVKKNPNDLQALINLAHLLNDSGFKEKAIERYKEYLKIDSKNADVIVDMGVCYFETGNNTEAINSMEKALKIQPKHQIAHLNLGIVNMTIGNLSKANEWWRKAVAINPSNEIGKKAEELIKSH